jgi:hypothetical protein
MTLRTCFPGTLDSGSFRNGVLRRFRFLAIQNLPGRDSNLDRLTTQLLALSSTVKSADECLVWYCSEHSLAMVSRHVVGAGEVKIGRRGSKKFTDASGELSTTSFIH